jgi:hypothetical protein
MTLTIAIVYTISCTIDYDIGYAIWWQNNYIFNIVSKNHLREVGVLLRRASISKDLAALCTLLNTGISSHDLFDQVTLVLEN